MFTVYKQTTANNVGPMPLKKFSAEHEAIDLINKLYSLYVIRLDSKVEINYSSDTLILNYGNGRMTKYLITNESILECPISK